MGESWTVEHLLEVSYSNETEIDPDGEGIEKLATYAPFLGSELKIWKPEAGKFVAIGGAVVILWLINLIRGRRK